MAQTQAAARDRRDGHIRTVGVLAGVACYAGGLAILVGGYARPGRTGTGIDNTAKAADAATYRAIGIFADSQTGGATDGATEVEVENRGLYLFKNSGGGDALTDADIESTCYIVDDETVAKTSPNNTRAKAGIVKDVTPEGVWVRIGYA